MNKQQNTVGKIRKSYWIPLLATGIMTLVSVACTLSSIISSATPAPTVRPTQKVNLATLPVTNIPVDMNTIGDPNASVKIDVWADFRCHTCIWYSENVEPLVLETYVKTGKVFYTYHFFPFFDGGDVNGESHQAANAAMCAGEQDKFWEYHALLMANWNGGNQGEFRDVRLLDFGRVLGLGTGFEDCFTSQRYADQIQQDFDLGRQWGVSGTPSVFVNEVLLTPGYAPSFDDVSAAVEAALGSG